MQVPGKEGQCFSHPHILPASAGLAARRHSKHGGAGGSDQRSSKNTLAYINLLMRFVDPALPAVG